MEKKNKIYYARTYRRIKIDVKFSLLFTILMIVPTVAFLITCMDDITGVLSHMGADILSNILGKDDIHVVNTQYSIINNISFIDIPTSYPTFSKICLNLVFCMCALLVMEILKFSGKPLAIFLMYSILIHTVNCVYFVFGGDYFPYSIGQYSELYIKQQIGIWITFSVLAGFVLGFMGEKAYLQKALTFTGIMLYSIIFGCIRYILYIFILYKFSVLYMAFLFFVIGPMFDFSYFVAIYAIFFNKSIKDYGFGKKKGEWEWS